MKDAVQNSDRPDVPTGQEDGPMIALSEILGFVLPPACEAGVMQNLALLAQHWAVVRGAGAGQEAA